MTAHASDRVQSVDRAVGVLEYLSRGGWCGVTDVGRALDVHKSTAFRLLNTLESHGLVERDAESGTYRLGFGLVHLAHAVTVGPDLVRQVRPACEWLSQQSSETVTLSVLVGQDSVTVDQIMSTSTVVTRSWLGRRTPLHCASPGKVFLASLEPDRRARIIAGPHERHTDRTVTDAGELRAQIERVRTHGYATAIEELEEELSSAAAPVRGADGSVVAAIGVSGPSYRLEEARMDEIVRLVRQAAARASGGIGRLG